jgi:TonB family protein
MKYLERKSTELLIPDCGARKAADNFLMCFHRGILLSILCSSIAFGASQVARAQDAASPGLLEPAITVKATPTPRPKKRTSEPTVEIPTEAASEKPPPIAEETPRIEELATPAPPTEKKTPAKKRATPAAQPGLAEFRIVATMSLSAAKAVAVSTPIPEYPYEARRAHITRSGVCVMTVDTASGDDTSAVMEQSRGNGILDKVTTDAFRKWRFKPGTVSQIRVPISYQ